MLREGKDVGLIVINFWIFVKNDLINVFIIYLLILINKNLKGLLEIIWCGCFKNKIRYLKFMFRCVS